MIGKGRKHLAVVACVLALMTAAGTSTAEGRGTGPRQVRAIICDVFGDRCGQALRVARCESNLEPWAVGRAGERGIYQIHPIHFGWLDEARLWNPRYNAQAAFKLSKRGRDWTPWWNCRP